MIEYVLPQHANIGGTVFGGQIMAWVDLCAAICAQRHAGRPCVTAFVDDLLFKRPVRVGQVVRLRAQVVATFRTSMEIEVTCTGRTPSPARMWPTVECRVVFVAIDEARKPDARPAAASSRRDADRAGAVGSRGAPAARGSRRGELRAMPGGHERSAHRGPQRARRRDRHPPRLALQQAVERQAPLPRGARRHGHRAVRRLQGQRVARGSSPQADHLAQESSLEVTGTREGARQDRGPVRARREGR